MSASGRCALGGAGAIGPADSKRARTALQRTAVFMPESIRAVESRGHRGAPFRLTIRRLFILVLLVLLITGVPAVAEFYTDWLWFQELGFEKVFVRALAAQSLVATSTGVAVFALLAMNLLVALRSLRPRPFMIATPQGPQTVMMDPARVKPLALAA